MAQKVETEDKICSTSILSAICGNHLQTLARYCFRTLNKLLINTTGYTSFSGLLKVSEKKNKKFSKSHCKYFKISRKLLLERFDELTDEQKQPGLTRHLIVVSFSLLSMQNNAELVDKDIELVFYTNHQQQNQGSQKKYLRLQKFQAISQSHFTYVFQQTYKFYNKTSDSLILCRL